MMTTSLLDTTRFKTAGTIAVALATVAVCALLAHRGISYQRGVWGSGIYAGGDPARAYPYLVRAARAGWLCRGNALPLLDLGEVGTWAMDDVTFLKYHRELTPALAARLAFVSYAQALQARPTSSTAMAGMADLFRRMGALGVPPLGEPAGSTDLEAVPRAAETRERADRLVQGAYETAMGMEPANYFWDAYLADFFVERGRRAEALPLYGRAIELMPDLGWHYYLGPSGPLPADLFETARSSLERARSTNVVFRPEKIESNIGYLYERQRDYEQALDHYRRAIELAPDPSQYLYQAAVVLGYRGQRDEAIEYFERALKRGTLGPRLEQAASTSLGRILIEKGDSRQAVKYLTRARALQPGSYDLRLDLGRAWQALGETQKAEQEYQQALSLDPGQRRAYLLLIELYRSKGDYARAIPLARRLAEQLPDDADVRSQLDALYKEMATGRSPR